METYPEVVRTYPELNATNPIGRSTDRWVFTVRGGSNVGFVYLTVVALAATGSRVYRDALQEESVIPMPRPDAGASEQLYAFDALPDLEDLAEARGVQPINDIDELVADFWPEDESIDDFIATVQRWRDEEDIADS